MASALKYLQAITACQREEQSGGDAAWYRQIILLVGIEVFPCGSLPKLYGLRLFSRVYLQKCQYRFQARDTNWCHSLGYCRFWCLEIDLPDHWRRCEREQQFTSNCWKMCWPDSQPYLEVTISSLKMEFPETANLTQMWMFFMSVLLPSRHDINPVDWDVTHIGERCVMYLILKCVRLDRRSYDVKLLYERKDDEEVMHI